jgi:DNA-directed RNA polymerase specialized sigma24 family protein
MCLLGVGLSIQRDLHDRVIPNPPTRFSDPLTPAERAREVLGLLAQLLYDYPGLMRHLEKQVVNAAEPEDLLQDFFLALFCNPPDLLLPELECGQPSGRWLRQVIIRDDLDRWRAHRRHRAILTAGVLRPGSWLAATAGSADSAEKIALRQIEEKEILAAILRLPRRLGRVAYLAYAGFRPAETAGILGIPVGRVYASLRTIRSARIRRALGLNA